MASGLTIQSMQPEDLDFAASCTAAEGWVTETYSQFEDLYLHDPHGCFIARVDGQNAGICIATAYTHSGFIGELIVRPEFRQRGIGAALLETAITYLHARGARTLYLDGVIPAVPLYQRLGFRKVCRSLRLTADSLDLHGEPVGVLPMQAYHLAAVFDLDRRAFGDDRSFFLERRWRRYPELCKVLVEEGELKGFIMGRRGEGVVAAGPWVTAPHVSEPKHLLLSLAREAIGGMYSIGILENNSHPVRLACELGMEQRSDSPWRMALGPDDDLGRSPLCLAVGTAGKG